MNTDPKPKVVIVEDDTFLVKFYKAKFEQNGFTAVGIEDGLGAVAKIKAEQPNLIILDIGLPNVDGFSILQELKKDPETKDIHVIILTKLAQDSDREIGSKLGATKYMVKMEVRLDEVIEEAKKCVNGKFVPVEPLPVPYPDPLQCPKCLKPIVTEASFCPWCGTKLDL